MPNVNVANGEMCHAEIDFELPGVIPVVFRRCYRTGSKYCGPLGNGWRHPFDLRLFRKDKTTYVFIDGEGEQAEFEGVAEGVDSIRGGDTPAPLKLRRTENRCTLILPDKRNIVFETEDPRYDLIKVSQIEDLNNNAIRFDYDEHGRLAALVDTFGRNISISSDRAGRITQISMGLGRSEPIVVSRYEYDEQSNLVRAKDGFGNPMFYEYENKLMVKYTNRLGGPCYFAYDARRRCLSYWREAGETQKVFLYDDQKKKTLVTNSLGHKKLYVLNDFSFVTLEEDPLGGKAETIYDAKGNYLARIDQAGNTGVLNVYEPGDRRLMQFSGSGACWTYQYDSLHQIESIKDPRGVEWKARFDERGNLKESITPLGLKYRYGYDRNGFLNEMVAPNERTTKIARSQDRLQGSIKDDLGTIAHYRYGIWGQLTEVVDALGNATVLQYDAGGRIVAMKQPDGAIARYQYDAEGDLVAYADEAGNLTRFQYNRYGVCIAKIDALGHRIRYEYDSEFNLVGIMNEQQEGCTFEYDALERMVRRTLFNGRTHGFEYDAAGKMTAVIDLRTGNRLSFGYNAASQVNKVSCGDYRAVYEYDLARRLQSASVPGSSVAWTFDGEGRLVQEQSDDLTVDFTFDAEGNRAGMRNSRTGEETYTYDIRNRIIGISYDDNKWILFEYDLTDRVVRRRLSNGCSEALEYDSCGRIRSRTISAASGGTIIGLHYRYDVRGLLTEVVDRDRDNTFYEYDQLGQLVSVIHNGQLRERFAYDPAGNVVSSVDFATISYDQGNRITRAGQTRFEHDHWGDLVSRTGGGKDTIYEYGMGSLRRIINENDETFEYEYDAFSRRIRGRRESEETTYYWNLHVLVGEERGGPEGELTTYHFYPDSFIPLAMSKGDRFYFFVVDHLGTPFALLDEEGRLAWHAVYSAWGEVRELRENRVDNPLRFPGQYQDATGLHYNRYRYYDPRLGRYLSPDPLGLNGGLNLYRYTPNPVNWTDPLGLSAGLVMPPNVTSYSVVPCTPSPPTPPNCPPANPPANPAPPPAKGCFTASTPPQLRGGGGPPHNQTLNQIDQRNGLSSTGGDFRVNQQQVTGGAVRVGRNRPDMQVTIGGQRQYVEVDTGSAPRAACHASQICQNDPQGVVHLVGI